LQAQQIKAAAPTEPAKKFVPQAVPLPEHEKLVYKAKFLGITIGQFTLINNGRTIFNGQEAYRFELIVKTPLFFKKIFKPKDRYVSYLDAQKFVVLRHEEYITGGTILESAVDFDHKNHVASYKNFIDRREKTVKIPDRILDVLSGIFYLRMIPWELGDTAEISVYADEKIYDYIGLLHSKVTVDLPSLGRQEAYFLKPYVFLDGQQIKKISAEVLFSTAVPRKALRAVLKTPVGNVVVVLFEGFQSGQAWRSPE